LIMFVGFMMFIVIFNNISAKSWLSVLLMDETGGPEKNHRRKAITLTFYLTCQ
jgi:di/tricarboxylate transporter